MKRICMAAAILFLALFLPAHLYAEEVESKQVTREINVVYDDSGSMICTDGKAVDTWCQAKYAMEVFASMLGPGDTLNIYTMSDYSGGKAGQGSHIPAVNGSDGAEINVKKVHDMLTEAAETPFGTVEAANRDLQKSSKDEKWLVVLTDGEFNETKYDQSSELNAYFAGKDPGVKVIYFTMGKNVTSISEDPQKDIYYWHTDNNDEILDVVTGICTQIFNSNKLDDVSAQKKTAAFDVPMSQLIVFAQGADVDIKGITDSKGNTYNSIAPPVSVKYSDIAATNQADKLRGQPLKIATGLKGEVATFEGDFPAGEYQLDVEGAKKIEVYYKPNVEIAVYLKNADGEEVTDFETLEAGEYTIDFGFVKAGTNEIVPESKLLGEVTYGATVTNNGKKHDKVYVKGDKIRLEEGGLDIDATATFLAYNSVTTSRHYDSVDNKEVTIELTQDQAYHVYSQGISSGLLDKDRQKKGEYPAAPVTFRMKLDGRDFTPEEWEALTVPGVEITGTGTYELKGLLRLLKVFKWIYKTNTPAEMKVEKGKEPGEILLTPVIKGKPKTGAYVDVNYQLRCYSERNGSVWKGSLDSVMKIEDERGFLVIYGPSLLRLAIFCGIVFLLLGFTPLFKKRFPRKMKQSPTIEGRPRPFGRATTTHGRFTKDTLSSVLPFVAEVGTLKYVPGGTTGVPVMKLKAAGGSRVLITNPSAFAGRNEIVIDGMSITANQRKPVKKTCNMVIVVTTQEMEYTCTPRA